MYTEAFVAAVWFCNELCETVCNGEVNGL